MRLSLATQAARRVADPAGLRRGDPSTLSGRMGESRVGEHEPPHVEHAEDGQQEDRQDKCELDEVWPPSSLSLRRVLQSLLNYFSTGMSELQSAILSLCRLCVLIFVAPALLVRTPGEPGVVQVSPHSG